MTKPNHVKYALFLHVAGEKAIEVYHVLAFTEAEKGNYNALVKQVSKIYRGQKKTWPTNIVSSIIRARKKEKHSFLS